MDVTLNARIRRLMDDASTLADESRVVVQHYRRRRLLSPQRTRPTMLPLHTAERETLANETR